LHIKLILDELLFLYFINSINNSTIYKFINKQKSMKFLSIFALAAMIYSTETIGLRSHLQTTATTTTGTTAGTTSTPPSTTTTAPSSTSTEAE
jgi:hypothetical protein